MDLEVTHRIQDAYTSLRDKANTLNVASDTLGNVVSILDEQLKKLNLGVSGWFQLAAGDTWSRHIGYTKFNQRWGLALKNVRDGKEEIWSFNDAPRWMRVESIGKIPDLLETLDSRAMTMVASLEQAASFLTSLSVALEDGRGEDA